MIMKNENRKKFNFSNLELYAAIGIWILGAVLALSLICLEIYCYVVYGNKNSTDIPTWVWWFMWGWR
jgi:hypothetical protein